MSDFSWIRKRFHFSLFLLCDYGSCDGALRRISVSAGSHNFLQTQNLIQVLERNVHLEFFIDIHVLKVFSCFLLLLQHSRGSTAFRSKG